MTPYYFQSHINFLDVLTIAMIYKKNMYTSDLNWIKIDELYGQASNPTEIWHGGNILLRKMTPYYLRVI